MFKIAIIKKLPSGKYRLYSRKKDKSGKRRNLGTFDSLEKAKKHEGEVNFFKGQGNDDGKEDKETHALKQLSYLAQYLEKAGYIKEAEELYDCMDGFGNFADDAGMLTDYQRNTENQSSLSNQGFSQGTFNAPEAERLAGLANKLDKLGHFEEADLLDAILSKWAGMTPQEYEKYYGREMDAERLKEYGEENKKDLDRTPNRNQLNTGLPKGYGDEFDFSEEQKEIVEGYILQEVEGTIDLPDIKMEGLIAYLRNQSVDFIRMGKDGMAAFYNNLSKHLSKVKERRKEERLAKEFQEQLKDSGYYEQSAKDDLNPAQIQEMKRNKQILENVKYLKHDFNAGNLDDLIKNRKLKGYIAWLLGMNQNNSQEGGFIDGLMVAMGVMEPNEAGGDPEAYQSGIIMFENPVEMDNVDMLAHSNGLQTSTNDATNQFQGLSDAYFYTSYDNLDNRYKISP